MNLLSSKKAHFEEPHPVASWADRVPGEDRADKKRSSGGRERRPIKSIWCLLAKLGAKVEDHWRKSLCPTRWHKTLTG